MQHADDRALQLRLVAVYRQLSAALEQRDWESFAGIDQTLRQCLVDFTECEAVSEQTLLIKRQLQALHGRAIAACSDVCDKLRQVLQNHREYDEARSAYVRIDLLNSDQ